MRRSVGIREVAAEAGVSITTVSHALNGKGRLSNQTREHVKEVAHRLGYRPNAVARNLAGGRSGLIGLSVAQMIEGQFAIADFAYYAQLMNAATVAAFDRGFALVLASGTKESAWNNLMLDGLIVVDPIRDDPVWAEFSSRGIPVVTTGRVPGDPDGYWIDNDHFEATPAILDHLAARGAERIALIGTPPVTTYATDSREAYERWCIRNGKESMVVIARHDLTEVAGYEATLKLLRRNDPPDAIYAMLDRMAIGALLAGRAEGFAVPRQLQIAGCTDSEAGRLARPSLTALALNPEQIGREAVSMIATLIEGGQPPNPHVMVPTKIIPRGSTRKKTFAATPPLAAPQP
ncbi:MAG: LacI family DNA-binding transcriptional regulator [Solirubrobacteraceae bacterium]